MNTTNRKTFARLLLALAFIFIFIFQMGGGAVYRTAVSARAETSEVSSVIKDLTADKNFNFADYPEELYNFSIEVIQIAESEDGELLIYTYQPCQSAIKLICREVNMSFSDKLGGEVTIAESADKPRLYKLKQVSTWGVFSKYLVEGVTVSSDNERFYNITSLYRDYDKLVDDGSLKDEHGIAVNVGQCWKAETVGGAVQYAVKKVDTITITDCLYGTIRVPEGFNFAFSYSCDMHVIAFDTDIKMDDLLEADVAFKYSYIEKGIYGQDTGYKWHDKTVTVNYKEKGTSEDHIFGKGKKTWDRIQKGADFVMTLGEAKIEMSDEMENDLWNKQWVLAFWDTAYEDITGGVFGWLNYVGAVFGGTIYRATIVKDATVIRLEFLKDGKHYNLGAVSNKSGEFDVIGGGDETFIDDVKKAVDDFFNDLWNKFKNFFVNLPWWAWLLIAFVPLSIALAVLSIIFPPVWAVVKTVLKTVLKLFVGIFKALWWLLCLPFRGIAALFNRKSKKK